MFDLSNKYQIMPFVTLYKNAFKDIDSLLNSIKLSEEKESDSWSEWDIFGTKNTISDISNYHKSINSNYNIEKEINEIIEAGLDEYIDYWIKKKNFEKYPTTNPEHWKNVFPDFVTNWDYKTNLVRFDEDFESCESVMTVSGKSGWITSGVDILKHKTNTLNAFAIGYHIDTDGSADTPGPKTILTATLYINDDYEGGGVSYLNEFDDTIVNYKPSAGDLIIFPSSKPFFHAALPLSGDNSKYLARKFLRWKSVGSEIWENYIKENGEDFTLKFYTEKRKIESSMGYYTKRVFLPGETRSIQGQHGDPFFANEVIDFNKEIKGDL